MKIISGTLGGRHFNSPHGHRTHPMSDKARGALFNSLGDIDGITVLDAFAGSGALGFEALSRGAQFATMIDSDRRAYTCMTENAASLGVSQHCKITQANVSSWSDNNSDKTFAIVIAAPPYDKLQPELVKKLTRHTAQAGMFVVDWPGKLALLVLEGMALTNQKNYGDAQLLYYRFAS